jgi:hypothetical protein
MVILIEENRSTWRKTEVLGGKPKYLKENRSTWRKTEVLGGKPKYLEENLWQCHFVHHKSDKAWCGVCSC